MRINTVSNGYSVTVPELVSKIFSQDLDEYERLPLQTLYTSLLDYQTKHDTIIEEFTIDINNPISRCFQLQTTLSKEDIENACNHAIIHDDNNMHLILKTLIDKDIDFINNGISSELEDVIDYITQVRDYGFVKDANYTSKRDNEFYFVDQSFTITYCVVSDVKKNELK